MSRFMIIQHQLLATKFFVPVASHPLIARPRLDALLQESLHRPLTVVSTPQVLARPCYWPPGKNR